MSEASRRRARGASRDWLVLARISNLLTVWTNVLVGLAAGHVVAVDAAGPIALAVVLPGAGGVLLATSAIYIAGMMLNDVCDLRWDRARRPERPLASGRIGPRSAMLVAAALLTAALGTLALAYRDGYVLAFGAALIAAVLGYDVAHKRFAGAAVLMGACRALVYLAAAAVAAPPTSLAWWSVLGPIAAGIGLYVTAVTLIAQREADAEAALRGPRRVLAMLMPPLVLAMLLAMVSREPARAQAVVLGWGAATVAGVALLVWLGYASRAALARPARLGRAVPAWLAGLAAIDVGLLVLLAAPGAAALAGICFVLCLLAQRWVPAS